MTPADDSLPAIIGLGAGGHCKVLIEILRRIGTWRIAALVDSDESRKGQTFQGVPILGSDDQLPRLRAEGIRAAFLGIGSIGSPATRKNAFVRIQGLDFELPVLIHPFSAVAADVIIGAATCVMPGVVINSGTKVGCGVILNSGSIIEHDCEIGDFVHVSPGAVLGGNVRVGYGSHIGIGAVIRQGVCIGQNAMIGAGAVVIRDVLDGTTVVGVPAGLKL